MPKTLRGLIGQSFKSSAAEKAKVDAERKAILDKHLIDNPVFDKAMKAGQAEAP